MRPAIPSGIPRGYPQIQQRFLDLFPDQVDILVIGAPDLESALRSFVASYWQLSITTTIGVWHQGQLVARIVPGTDPQGQPMPMLETIRS